MCDICDQEMSGPQGAISCWDGHEFVAENPDHPVWKDFPEIDPTVIKGDLRCPDCNVAPGGLHHSGCDMESCVINGHQMLLGSCGDHCVGARWAGQ